MTFIKKDYMMLQRTIDLTDDYYFRNTFIHKYNIFS